MGVPVGRDGTQASDFRPPHDAYVVDGNAYAYVPGVLPDGTVQEPLYYATTPESFSQESTASPESPFQFSDDAESFTCEVSSESGSVLSEGPRVISSTDAGRTLQPARVHLGHYYPRPRHFEEFAQTSFLRHVPMSPHPQPLQSVDQGQPGGDRTTSHAFAEGLTDPVRSEVGEDLML